MISLINTKTNRILENPQIQVLRDRSFLDFNLKIFFKNYSQLIKYCLIISSVDNIISRNRNIGHNSTREDLDADIMIDCDFFIFQNCSHCTKELITLSSGWICYLNSIYALKEKRNVISIERNIEVIFFKPVYIIGWWNDTDSFMNVNIYILECMADIQILSMSPCIAAIVMLILKDSECATGMQD